MKYTRPFTFISSRLLFACLIWSLAPAGWSQGKPSDKAQSLLQEVRERELERQRETKMKDVERLNEDLEKAKKEADDLRQTIERMNAAVTDSTNHLAQLNAQKRQFTKMLEVIALQIDAEGLKLEGLKMLAVAQTKGVAAIDRRREQTEVKATIEKTKLNPMPQAPRPGTPEGDKADLEIERKLDKAERAVSTARVDAREAMSAATTKLQAANDAGEKVKQKAAELGIPIRGEPSPTEENVEPLTDIDPIETVDIPKALPANE